MPSKHQGTILVLTQYPIIDQLRNKVAAKIGKNADFLVVSTIAAQGYLELTSKLRRRRFDCVYIFIADETMAPLVTILKILSLSIPTSNRYVIHPDFLIEQFSVVNVLGSIAKLVTTIGAGFLAMSIASLRVSWLHRCPRIRIVAAPSDINKDVAYVRTNLWLGVQAGGALTHTWGVIRGMAKRGLSVKYLSADDFTLGNVSQVEHVPIIPNHIYIVPRELNHFLYHYDFLKLAKKELSQFKGAVYQRTSIGNYCGVEISRRLRMPLILEYNGSESWLSRNWGTPFQFLKMVEATEKVSLRHAHLIVTVSDVLRRELIARGVADERILVHPNGVNLEDFPQGHFDDADNLEVRELYNIPSDAIVVTFVGTFGPWHGVEVLATAAKLLLKNNENSKLYFLFIGDGVRRPEVEDIAGDLIQSGRVILTSLIKPNDVPKYLNASDILVAPTVNNPDKSPFFGSPTKVFEYMAAGRPIIASDIGQITEIFADSPRIEELQEIVGQSKKIVTGAMGIRVMPGNVSQLVAAIEFCERNPKWRQRAGLHARECVEQKYTWQHHVSAIFDKLDKVLKNESPKGTRILINGLHSKSGGGVTYLRNMLPLLAADERLDIHLCLHNDQVHLFESVLNNITVHKADIKGGLLQLLMYEQLRVPMLSRKIRAEVVFSPANYGPLFAARSVLLLRNALSVAFVENRLSKLLYWALLYLGTILSLLIAKRAISVSDYARTSAAGGALSIIQSQFTIIPHGISDFFQSSDIKKRSKTELLAVSDIYVQKNLHSLFEAISLVITTHPNVKLRVAGAPLDPDYLERLRGIIKDRKLENYILFEGSVSTTELRNLYQKCAVFVFPSTVETFGNPLVEAMACGAPIACSNTAAMPEVAADAAVYFNPHDIEDMAKVIIGILDDETKRTQLSKLALERAKKFSWNSTAKLTADVLIDASQN